MKSKPLKYNGLRLFLLCLVLCCQQTKCLAQSRLDSLDKIQNNVTGEKLLISGYTHFNRKAERFWNLGPALQNLLQFNTVEGAVLSENMVFNQGLSNQKFISVGAAVRYGFSNEKLGVKAYVNYLLNRAKDLNVRLEAGQYTAQFNALEPIGILNNTVTSLFWAENLMKIYQKKFAQLSLKTELSKGLNLSVSGGIEERTALTNTNLYSFKAEQKRQYSSNDPQFPNNPLPSFAPHQAILLEINLKILPEKWTNSTDITRTFPQFSINYSIGRKEVDFDKLQLRASQYHETALGSSRWGIIGTTFLNARAVQFMDYQHFISNQSAFGSGKPEAFALLDSYGRSNKTQALQVYFAQYFRGYFFRKVPVLKELAWHEVLNTRVLYTPEDKLYGEFSVGIDNIFQVYRLDFASGFSQEKSRFAVRFGLSL